MAVPAAWAQAARSPAPAPVPAPASAPATSPPIAPARATSTTPLLAAPLLGEVAADTAFALAFEAPSAVAASWLAFVRTHEQRTLAERAALELATLREQVGLDPTAPQDFVQAGLEVNSGAVMVAEAPPAPQRTRRPVVLMARVADAALARSFAVRFAGGLAPPPAVPVGSAELHPAGPSQSGVWALADGILFLAPTGGGEALRHQLQARAAGALLAARAGKGALRPPAGRVQATAFVPASFGAPCSENWGQLLWLSFGADGLDLRGRSLGIVSPACPLASDPPLALALPAAPVLPSWGIAQAASLRQVALVAAAWLGWGSSWSLLHHPERAPQLARAQRELLAYEIHHRDLDGPVGLTVGHQAGEAQWLVRGVAPSAAGLAQAGQALCGRADVLCRRESVGKAPWRIARPRRQASPWQVGWAGRWALASNAPVAFAEALRAATQSRLPIMRAAATASAGLPSAPLVRASAQLATLAGQLTQQAIDEHHKGWLAWFPVPQLLLSGPAGDGLHELASLGSVELTVWREQSAIFWHLQQRRPLTMGTPL